MGQQQLQESITVCQNTKKQQQQIKILYFPLIAM
jgi:hypothetical protein